MNIEFDASVKIKVNEDAQRPETSPPTTNVAALVCKIASQPWVATIVREILRNS